MYLAFVSPEINCFHDIKEYMYKKKPIGTQSIAMHNYVAELFIHF